VPRGITPKRLKIKTGIKATAGTPRDLPRVSMAWLDTCMLPQDLKGVALDLQVHYVLAGRRPARVDGIVANCRQVGPGLQERHRAPPLSHTPPLGGSPEFIWSPDGPKAPIQWRWESIPKIRSDSRYCTLSGAPDKVHSGNSFFLAMVSLRCGRPVEMRFRPVFSGDC
jgi:hypothetical protein